MPRNRSLILGLLAVVTVSAVAQEKSPSRVPTVDETAAIEAMKAADARVYTARSAGLKDLRFRWKIGGSGPFVGGEHYIEFAWDHRKPYAHVLRLFDSSGRPLAAPPAVWTESLQSRRAYSFIRQQLVALAFSRVIGLPSTWAYRDYYKAVKKREINHRIETRIVMVPRRKKLNRKVVMVIRDGVPYQFVKTPQNGIVNRMTFRYEKRGDRFLCVGMKTEINNRVMLEENYRYVKRRGIIVLESVERLSNSGPVKKETIRLEDIHVNEKSDRTTEKSKN